MVEVFVNHKLLFILSKSKNGYNIDNSSITQRNGQSNNDNNRNNIARNKKYQSID